MAWNIDLRTFLGEARTRRWLLLTIALALVLRLLFLGRSIWFDEAATLTIAAQGYGQIIAGLSTQDFNPPLYFLLIKSWMLLSTNLLWVELFSVLVGTATVFLMYRWGKVLYHERVGLFAAFLFAIACLQIRFSQEIRMYSLVVLLTVASNYYFTKVVREERFREGPSTWVKYALVTVLSLYVHYYAFFNLLIQNGYLFWRYRDRGLLKMWAIAQLAIAGLFAPWVPSMLAQVQSMQGDYWISRPTIGTLGSAFTYLGDNLIGITVLAILSIGGLVSLYRIRQRKIIWRSEKRNLFLLTLILLPILLSFTLSFATQSIFHERYFILFAPPLYLLAAKGLSHLTNRYITWGALTAFAVAMGLCLVPFYASAQQDFADAAHYLQQHVQPSDAVVHLTPATLLPFRQYGVNGRILSSKPLPAYLGGKFYAPDDYVASTFDIVASAQRVLFVDLDGFSPKVERAMQSIGTQESQGKFGTVWVTVYRLTIDRAALVRATNATLEREGLTLVKAEVH